MSFRSVIFFVFTGVMSCSQVTNNAELSVPDSRSIAESPLSQNQGFINESGENIKDRFIIPNDFSRSVIDSTSFKHYLRHLPLKKHGAMVQLYNGESKPDRNVYLAVVDKEIGTRDLHQCADAVMRLRAEFLYSQKKYKEIHFNLTNGFSVPYSKWMEGERVKVVGNKTKWIAKYGPSNTDEDFWKYLEFVFAYAGTLSLDKELNAVAISDINIGDVFIKGGSPGHAVIVVDMIENIDNRKKKFMLAQSYMPAQEIQILRNPANSDKTNPWYDLYDFEIIQTPEWTFNADQLKRFSED